MTVMSVTLALFNRPFAPLAGSTVGPLLAVQFEFDAIDGRAWLATPNPPPTKSTGAMSPAIMTALAFGLTSSDLAALKLVPSSEK